MQRALDNRALAIATRPQQEYVDTVVLAAPTSLAFAIPISSSVLPTCKHCEHNDGVKPSSARLLPSLRRGPMVILNKHARRRRLAHPAWTKTSAQPRLKPVGAGTRPNDERDSAPVRGTTLKAFLRRYELSASMNAQKARCDCRDCILAAVPDTVPQRDRPVLGITRFH